jgi:hypothetical protein
MPPKRDYPSFSTPTGARSNAHLTTQAQVDKWHDAGLKYPQPQEGESQYFYTQRLSRELKTAKKNNPDMFKSRLAPAAAPKPRGAAKLKPTGFVVPHKEAARSGRYNIRTLGGGSMAALLGMKTLNDRSRIGR